MAITDVQNKLDSIIKGLPASGFDTVPDSVIADLSSCAAEADSLGMKSGKEAINNLITVLKSRKTGEKTDDSVTVRITALEFYTDKIRNEDLGDL
jgi:sulfite reductase beta subunit-like hemoprotein